jgi:hypothetical protein
MGPRRCRRGRRPAPQGVPGTDPASMGPRRCRRGRRKPVEFDVNRVTELQWGHGDAAVEDLHIVRPLDRVDGASMGPRRCRRGRRLELPVPVRRLRDASMGPRRCRRGRPRAVRATESLTFRASMGPRRCRRGRHDAGPQRGRATRRASMGPRRCRRGRPVARTGLHVQREASMGPRRCRRGRPRGTRSADCPTRRFNGATAMPPWKTRRSWCRGPSRPLLQWGHGDAAVEDRRLSYPQQDNILREVPREAVGCDSRRAGQLPGPMTEAPCRQGVYEPREGAGVRRLIQTRIAKELPSRWPVVEHFITSRLAAQGGRPDRLGRAMTTRWPGTKDRPLWGGATRVGEPQSGWAGANERYLPTVRRRAR